LLKKSLFLRATSISTSATIAACISIFASLWIGLALLMAVGYAKKLPADAFQATRIGFGVLTFFLWYAGMLGAMSTFAMLTVRTFQELKATVLVLLGLTALLWSIRYLLRRLLVRGASSGAALDDGEHASKR
jgi:hypothetical protein